MKFDPSNPEHSRIYEAAKAVLAQDGKITQSNVRRYLVDKDGSLGMAQNLYAPLLASIKKYLSKEAKQSDKMDNLLDLLSDLTSRSVLPDHLKNVFINLGEVCYQQALSDVDDSLQSDYIRSLQAEIDCLHEKIELLKSESDRLSKVEYAYQEAVKNGFIKADDPLLTLPPPPASDCAPWEYAHDFYGQLNCGKTKLSGIRAAVTAFNNYLRCVYQPDSVAVVLPDYSELVTWAQVRDLQAADDFSMSDMLSDFQAKGFLTLRGLPLTYDPLKFPA